MATLFTRIIGTDTGEVYDENSALIKGGKIPLHIFTALMGEYADGKITGQQFKAVLKLDADETADSKYLYDLQAACSKRAEFKRVFKDQLYLGEWRGTQQYYSDEASFWSRLESVLIDAGDTLPVRA